MSETIRVANAVKQALKCDGVYLTQANGVAAGQDIFHVHLPVYPRWLAPHGDDAPLENWRIALRARSLFRCRPGQRRRRAACRDRARPADLSA